MKKCLFALVALAMVLLTSSHAWAAQMTDLTLQIEGIAPIEKNDLANARKEAVRNALEKAIIQAASSCLQGEAQEEAFMPVKSIVIERADRYISYYRIISENRQDNEYTVHVNVVIALVSLKDDLLQMGVLQQPEEKTKTNVMIMIRNTKKYSDFKRFRNYLQGRPKVVKSFYPCQLEWRQFQCALIVLGPFQNFLADMDRSGKYTMESVNSRLDVVEITMRVKEEEP